MLRCFKAGLQWGFRELETRDPTRRSRAQFVAAGEWWIPAVSSAYCGGGYIWFQAKRGVCLAARHGTPVFVAAVAYCCIRLLCEELLPGINFYYTNLANQAVWSAEIKGAGDSQSPGAAAEAARLRNCGIAFRSRPFTFKGNPELYLPLLCLISP